MQPAEALHTRRAAGARHIATPHPLLPALSSALTRCGAPTWRSPRASASTRRRRGGCAGSSAATGCAAAAAAASSRRACPPPRAASPSSAQKEPSRTRRASMCDADQIKPGQGAAETPPCFSAVLMEPVGDHAAAAQPAHLHDPHAVAPPKTTAHPAILIGLAPSAWLALFEIVLPWITSRALGAHARGWPAGAGGDTLIRK